MRVYHIRAKFVIYYIPGRIECAQIAKINRARAYIYTMCADYNMLYIHKLYNNRYMVINI